MKPFKTIDEQMDILKSRGMLVADSARDILLAENYYCIVNGYKEMFIDNEASQTTSDERYLDGTKFDDLYALFLFDRALREKTFHYLIKAEAIVKTISVYTFCEEHPEPNSFLRRENYTRREDYMPGQRLFDGDLTRFLALLEHRAYQQKKCRDSLAHYRKKHGYVPLWVLSNDLTFGNISYFFNLLPRAMQNRICRRILDLRRGNSPQLTPKTMRLALRTLVAFRNKCAHDERLFCEKVGPTKEDGYMDMIKKLSFILSEADIANLNKSLVELAGVHAASQEKALRAIAEAGIPTA